MTGGRYLFRPLPEVSPVTITATGPDGWVGYRSWAMDAPDPVRANAPNGTGIAFILADGEYKNPCHWDVLGNGEEGQPDVAVVADGHAFVFSGKAGLYAQGPANRWHLYILDVKGARVVAVVLSYKPTPQTDLDVARNVIETLDIDT